jgi:type IV secretory pathway TrbD component
VEPEPLPACDPVALREDLGTEYYAVARIVGEFDGRLLTIKSWSVTLSLAAIGLGFQQQHYALFGLGALSAVAFWVVEWVTKRHQMRYYPRMRQIEVDCSRLNRLTLGEATLSAPRIDWAWTDAGRKASRMRSWKEPEPLTPDEIVRMLHNTPLMVHVLLPHVIAAVVGLALFVTALTTSWLGSMPP